jgi:hypothetical protein
MVWRADQHPHKQKGNVPASAGSGIFGAFLGILGEKVLAMVSS